MSKILVVDDSATMRKIIMRSLRQVGVDLDLVVQACNGVDALHELETEKDIGLVLCDVNMPEMNGIELVKEIRKDRVASSLPIVMITTEGGEAMREEAIENGADGYVSKPFTPDAIQAALERFLG